MLEFFNQIIGFFELLISLVVNMVNSLLLFINVLLAACSVPTLLTPYLPAFLGSAALITFALAVVKIVVGR